MGHFPLYWPISLVWMQPKTKEALPAGSTVITAIWLLSAVSSISSPFRRLHQADHIAEGKARPQHPELHALPFANRLKSLNHLQMYYKGSTFSSVILRPWVLVRPESNSRRPAWQPDANPTEPPVSGLWRRRPEKGSFTRQKKAFAKCWNIANPLLVKNKAAKTLGNERERKSRLQRGNDSQVEIA